MNRTTESGLERLAWWLDSSIRVPGTRLRVGLDGLLGLIPGVGDAVGAALSSYIIVEAARLGVPNSVLARMVLNVAVETLLGVIPVVGDLFDFAWKANRRNVRLLQAYQQEPRRTRRRTRGVIGIVAVMVLAMIAGVAWAAFELARWLWVTATGS